MTRIGGKASEDRTETPVVAVPYAHLIEPPEVPPTEIATDGDFVATDLEVVTVTPTSAVISWITRRKRNGRGIPAPVATTTQLKLGPVGEPMVMVHDDRGLSVFHQVHVTGLQPGRTYAFAARSNGQAPRPALRPTKSPFGPEKQQTFTTLVPPRGRYLTTIALANDIHIGETRQGINLGRLPTSVAAGDDDAYPETMFTGLVDELMDRGHPYLILNGDLTYNGTAEQVNRVVTIAGRYGKNRKDWLGLRGNHDHPRKTSDPFGDVIAPYQQLQTHREASGLRILGIDTTKGSAGGWITEEQFEQIADELHDEPDRPTLAASHHPVTNDAAMSSPAGPGFMLRLRDRTRLQILEAGAPGVFAHHTGHTHRMRRGRADVPGSRVHYFENAAGAAYPGGYSLMHIYEGGYLLNFWRTSTPEALQWVYRSRWQTLGFGPSLMLGTLEARNHVVRTDLSGLKPSGIAMPSELRI